MPHFILNKATRRFLADCIEIGLDNTEHSQDTDRNLLQEMLEELQDSEAIETRVFIAPKGGTLDKMTHHEYETFAGVTIGAEYVWPESPKP